MRKQLLEGVALAVVVVLSDVEARVQVVVDGFGQTTLVTTVVT